VHRIPVLGAKDYRDFEVSVVQSSEPIIIAEPIYAGSMVSASGLSQPHVMVSTRDISSNTSSSTYAANYVCQQPNTVSVRMNASVASVSSTAHPAVNARSNTVNAVECVSRFSAAEESVQSRNSPVAGIRSQSSDRYSVRLEPGRRSVSFEDELCRTPTPDISMRPRIGSSTAQHVRGSSQPRRSGTILRRSSSEGRVDKSSTVDRRQCQDTRQRVDRGVNTDTDASSTDDDSESIYALLCRPTGTSQPSPTPQLDPFDMAQMMRDIAHQTYSEMSATGTPASSVSPIDEINTATRRTSINTACVPMTDDAPPAIPSQRGGASVNDGAPQSPRDGGIVARQQSESFPDLRPSLMWFLSHLENYVR